MGDSGCLMMQPFSYVSGLPNFDPTEGNRNPIHSLGQSISFGRFVSDSISWEKWSVFSHNRYVEEAERFARPGSVAQKRAFFEAHYKEMAARKAAAAAAAAEQMNAVSDVAQNSLGAENETGNHSLALNRSDLNGQNGVGEAEQSGRLEMAKPLSKDLQKDMVTKEASVHSGKKKLAVVPSKSLRKDKASRQHPSLPVNPSTPAVNSRKEVYMTPGSNKKSTIDFGDKRRTTPKQVYSSSTTPINRTTARKIESSRVVGYSSVSRNCMTPTRLTGPPGGVLRNLVATPRSSRTPDVRAAVGSKSAGPRGQSVANDYSKLMSAGKSKLQSPSMLTPFKLRTIERAARTKEKLEEKFNADEAQKVQQQANVKDNAELELKKFRQTLCFKARPLPSFYKDKGTANKQTTKAPSVWPQSGRKPGLAAIQRTEDSGPATQRPIRSSHQSKQIQGKSYLTAAGCWTSRSYPATAENESPNVQRIYS